MTWYTHLTSAPVVLIQVGHYIIADTHHDTKNRRKHYTPDSLAVWLNKNVLSYKRFGSTKWQLITLSEHLVVWKCIFWVRFAKKATLFLHIPATLYHYSLNSRWQLFSQRQNQFNIITPQYKERMKVNHSQAKRSRCNPWNLIQMI